MISYCNIYIYICVIDLLWIPLDLTVGRLRTVGWDMSPSSQTPQWIPWAKRTSLLRPGSFGVSKVTNTISVYYASILLYIQIRYCISIYIMHRHLQFPSDTKEHLMLYIYTHIITVSSKYLKDTVLWLGSVCSTDWENSTDAKSLSHTLASLVHVWHRYLQILQEFGPGEFVLDTKLDANYRQNRTTQTK